MPASFNQARSQLQFAIDMVSGPGDLREKLCNAFKIHLLQLRPDDFPSELRQDFAALINEFCRSGLHKYGINCDRSHYLITENQSVGLVSKIITLHMHLLSHAEPGNSSGNRWF
ncbi:hypothetical protein Q8A64_08250 [Oxalobacteraceae bacterium R-40]|uniref:Uncharacterized protein n=1 Tax=Keguizhuia sedimenti TaxID=3064264 RepID=A0ABU1BN19_9BURK|nr:hypothetical protein [Oxalobacteraceae bacterium R-40]